MSLVQFNRVYKQFAGEYILKDINFTIEEKDKIGLVGVNGAGKSTIIRMLLDRERIDGAEDNLNEVGNIVKSASMKIGYLSQNHEFSDEKNTIYEEMMSVFAEEREIWHELQKVNLLLGTAENDELEKLINKSAELSSLYEAKGGYNIEYKIKQILTGLELTEEYYNLVLKDLSGGEQTRVSLAKLLLSEPDLLILDEPTNHLDMEMLEGLEGYLSSYRGGILIVSHDRYFMNRIVTGVVELDHHKATTYRGNYSRYVAQREERLKADTIAYEKQQEYIKKTEEYIDKYRAGIKSKMARGRQSQLNRLERLEAPETSHSLDFKFPPAAMSADKVLVLDHVSIGYKTDDPIIDDVSVVVRRGESVALIGPNGAGKSTMVKAIVGELFPTEGHIDIGNRVQVGYFSQEHEELHDRWQVVDEIINNYNFTEEKARNVLGSFLFKGDDVFKLVGDLSGGERARLALLKLFLQGDNFLILDEPTNHLDVPTREIVERALQQFGGTCFIISHDRYFLDQVSTRTLVLENKGLTEYLGNYSYYKEKLKEQQDIAALTEVVEEVAKEDVKSEAKTISTSPSDEPKKKTNTYMVEKQLAEVEEEIARLEATMKMYEVQLANPVVQQDLAEMENISKQLSDTESNLQKLYEKWEHFSELLA